VVPVVLPGVALAGAAGVGYVAGSYLEDNYLGDSRDYSGYTGGDALKSAIKEGATSMKVADEKVMSSIQNNIANSQTAGLAKGKAAVIKEMNAGNGESAATSAMQSAINEYFAAIQQNILTHYNSQLEQVKHHVDQVANHSDLTVGDVFASENGDDSPSNMTVNQRSLSLVDGTDATEKYLIFNTSQDGSTYESGISLTTATGAADFEVDSFSLSSGAYADYSDEFQYFQTVPMGNAFDAVVTERDKVLDDLSTFVSDVYSQYSAGDIPTEDIVDPITAATELRTNYDGMQGASAHAAMLGIPTNADQSVYMTLEDDGKSVWADVYTNKKITDSNGNEVGFQKGTTYDPTTWSEPLYIAFEYTETTDSDGNVLNSTQQESYDGETTTTEYSDFVEVEQPFTIKEITVDGESKQSFKTTSRNAQTADVSKLQEELEQIRQTQIDMQEEAQSGGGGGFSVDSLSLGGIPGEGVLLVGVGIAAWLFGN
nr:VP4 [Haloarcula hispanica pleomorphic virus 1]